MNTRRCELCGTLHGDRYGNVTVGVPRADVDYTTHDHYNLCEACSLKVYDFIEQLKTSDGKVANRDPLYDLVQSQNALISRMRMHIRNANHQLYSSLKGKLPARTVECIESAMNSLDKTEPYMDGE